MAEKINHWDVVVDRSMVVVKVNDDSEHPLTGFFSSVNTPRYPEVLESIALLKNCGYHYAAVYFKSIPAWELGLEEWELQVVDCSGKAKI